MKWTGIDRQRADGHAGLSGPDRQTASQLGEVARPRMAQAAVDQHAPLALVHLDRHSRPLVVSDRLHGASMWRALLLIELEEPRCDVDELPLFIECQGLVVPAEHQPQLSERTHNE